MLRSFLDSTSPILASAGLLGLGADTLGTALLILMAIAVIANQLWTLFERARMAIRNPEADTGGMASLETCELRHAQIEHALAGLKAEDARQDLISKEQFATLNQSLTSLRRDVRDDIKGLHKRTDDVLRAVSRLEGSQGSQHPGGKQ